MGSNLSKRKNESKDVQEEKEKKSMQCKLKELYKQLNIPQVAWMGDRMELPIQQFYVKLKLTSSDREIHHHEMFKEIETKRILVEGLPGYGKTTLATKIAHDWALNEEYIQRFNLVFLISIRELRDKSVIDAIVDLVEISGFEKPKEVLREIKEKEEKILLLLDGLDEVASNETDKILKILYKREMKQMTVVVTCRSGEFNLDPDKSRVLFRGLSIKTEFCDQHVTVLGIRNEDKIEFLKKFLHETESIDKVIEYLENVTETTREFFDSPLMLMLLADMIVRGGQIGPTTTRTNFYKDVINFMIRRSQERRNIFLSKSFNVFDEKNNENSSFKRKLHEFGYLCFYRVWNGNQLEFDEDELIKNIHQLGLVIIRRKLSNITCTNYYQIYHRTILEFMTAYYIHQEFLHNNLVFPKFLEQILIIDVHYYGITSMVTPFLIGLMKEKACHYFSMTCKFNDLFCDGHSGLGLILMECENLEQVETALIPNLPSKMDNYGNCQPNIYKRLVTLGVQSGRLRDIYIYARDDIHLPTDIELPNVHLDMFIAYIDNNVEGLKEIKCQRFDWFFHLYDEKSVNDCFEILLPQISANEHIFMIGNEGVIYFLKKEDKWPKNMEITATIFRGDLPVKDLCNLLDKDQIQTLKLEKRFHKLELTKILSHCKNVKRLYLQYCQISMDQLFSNKQWEKIRLFHVELTSPATKDFYPCKRVTLYSDTSISCALISKISEICYLRCNYDTLIELMTCSSWQCFHTITQIGLRLNPDKDYDFGLWKSFNPFHNLECLTISFHYNSEKPYSEETYVRSEILREVLLLPIPKIKLHCHSSVNGVFFIESVCVILRNIFLKCLNTIIIRVNEYDKDVDNCIDTLQFCSERQMSLKNLHLIIGSADVSIYETSSDPNIDIKYYYGTNKNVTVLLSVK